MAQSFPPLELAGLAGLLRALRVPWAVAGGWAIDLALGRVTRPHGDVDVALLREDQAALHDALPGWELRFAAGGALEPWPAGTRLRTPVHEVHGRSPGGRALEFLLNERDGDQWVYRRDPAVRLPMARAFRDSAAGVRVLAPEVVLLYKSRAPRAADEHDFRAALPLLDAEARRWLAAAIIRADASHPWAAALARSADTPEESALIGGMEPREILIAAYDPAWPARYESLAAVIREALGGTLLRLEHVGSTAVPGLAAKPIIDILAVVADAADEDAYVPRLAAAGYALRVREPEWFGHRMLRTAARDVHLHVYPPSAAAEIDRVVAFRDRLRANADDRARYEAVKRDLATQRWPDMNAYADAKTAVVESILAAATNRSP